MTKETLKNFALANDYAFALNAGISYANDQEIREAIAQQIEDADYIEESECADLDEEVANGCKVYKIVPKGEYTLDDILHIAYYD